MKDSDRREGPGGPPAQNSKHDHRQDRLKQALRENLKRRKAQARGREDLTQFFSAEASPGSVSSNGNEPSPYHGDTDKPDE